MTGNKNMIAGSDGSRREKCEPALSGSIGQIAVVITELQEPELEGEFWLPWVPRWRWSTATRC